jgi:AraC family transcriptional regulator of adaptative response/methylated-DNA-[protein]-cysteine methyltransferase
MSVSGVWRDWEEKTILDMDILSIPFPMANTNQSNKIKVPALFAGKAWQQVLARDESADGQFFYAVKTTKIYCRPSCPSRRPERKNVTFFPTPEQAQAAGYRACLRCEPDSVAKKADPQMKAIEAVSQFLTEHAEERTRLKDVAKATGVAPLTILRGFKRVLGVSPREFAKAQRVEKFKAKVREPKTTVTDAIYASGYGSSSRLYEGADALLGMTPSAMKAGGQGETIRYAVADSPLGPLLVGATSRGICSIGFADSEEELLAELQARFPKAETKRMDRELEYAVEAVIASMSESVRASGLPFDVRATAFQMRVWRELQMIPRGETRTYSEVAEALGAPSSVRAVASAIANNPLAVLVPCHRVIGKDGTLTGYRWGVERKRTLLEREGA